MATDFTSFDEAWQRAQFRVFGMRYVQVSDPSRGDLYLTEYGWRLRHYLNPRRWYDNHTYARYGRLPGGTGHVYRVPVLSGGKRPAQLVVKFNRFAQDVPIPEGTKRPEGVDPVRFAGTRFNGPFEEFGLLNELREGRFGPPALRVRTKRPLAVFCPRGHLEPWQLGRSRSRVHQQRHLHEGHQPDAVPHIPLHGDRLYVTVFGWVAGENAEDLHQQGHLTEPELHRLTGRVQRELAAKGFFVVDHKPKHFILRQGDNGRPLRRDGDLVYALVDFELLQRTDAYLQWLHERRAWEI